MIQPTRTSRPNTPPAPCFDQPLLGLLGLYSSNLSARIMIHLTFTVMSEELRQDFNPNITPLN